MSLVGYKSANHPQQVKRRGPRPQVDDRATTPEVFDPLNKRFNFTVDVAASDANKKCSRYWTIDQDGLSQSWAGERVWCNPPYSNIPGWVAKAWSESDSAELIVMLVPANRTEQRWWQDLIEPYRDCNRILCVEFLGGRLRFIAPGKTMVGPNERPPFGCCLLIWGDCD